MSIFDKLRKHDEERPKADFSNVQSGSSTTAAEPARPVPDLPPVTGTAGQSDTYVVAAGDSLSKIAKHYYGEAQREAAERG